jgi:Sec-independent protein secretion pathway component TatC
MLAVPLILLYEISIIAIRLTERSRSKALTVPEQAE